MNQTAAVLNQLLSPQLGKLETELGITIYQDDFFGVIRSVIADPAAFGLQNVRDSAGQNSTLTRNYLYWDNYHFTTAGHRILADSAASAIRIASCLSRVAGCRNARDYRLFAVSAAGFTAS